MNIARSVRGILPALALAASDASALQQLTTSRAAQRLADLQQQQCEVQLRIARLPLPETPELADSVRAIQEVKSRMHQDVLTLESELDLSPDVQALAAVIRASHLKEIILYSARGALGRWTPEGQHVLEAEIQRYLGRMRAAVAPTLQPVSCPAG